MSTKAFILLTFLLVNITYELGGSCDDKAIVNEDGSLVVEEDSDYFLQDNYKKSFYKSASCATLNTGDNSQSMCCYMKVRYKLDAAKSHYTSRGCVAVSFAALESSDSFDAMRKYYEEQIEKYYEDGTHASTVSDVDVDIDCYSKFIKFTALAFLMLLL